MRLSLILLQVLFLSAFPAAAQLVPETRPVGIKIVGPKKGQLFGSSRGALRFTEDTVQYDTTEKNDARTWWYANIKQLQVLSPTRIAVLPIDRFRLQVQPYEGVSTRTFVFELKRALPSEFYDALWTRVNPPGVQVSPASPTGVLGTRPRSVDRW